MQITAPLSDMSGLCTEKGDFCPALPNKIITIFGQYIDFISNNISSQNSQNAMVQGFSNNLNSTPPAVQSAMAPLSNAFKGIITKFISGLTGNNGQIDPLVALMTMGQDIMLASEIAIWICIGVFVLLALTSIMSSVQPAGWLVDSVVSMAVTIILFLTFLLWGAGLTIGLYLPLIPYLLFLFGGLAWMILVIEAMVASPLIALSLIVPSEDEIGKAAGALIILVGLFFRPILMIVGFVFAAKLLMVAVAMLNYGFENILNHTILGLGLFGSIAVIILYAGILISIVHEAFSLIYVLPEKALRWMGASGDGVDIASKLQKVEGAVDAGAKTSMGVAKGATSAAMKLSK